MQVTINFLRADSYGVNSNGDVIITQPIHSYTYNKSGSNVTQGPFSLDVVFDNLSQQQQGLGYDVSVSSII